MDVHKKNKSQGFTLVELMVTIAILAILSSIAYPSFENSLLNSRQTSQFNTLLAALQHARSEASSRNTQVTICGSSDQLTCNDPDWSDGFIIFDNVRVLQVFEDLSGNTINGGIINRGFIQFDNQGMANNKVFTICDSRGLANARAIDINGSGQARTGTAVACP